MLRELCLLTKIMVVISADLLIPLLRNSDKKIEPFIWMVNKNQKQYFFNEKLVLDLNIFVILYIKFNWLKRLLPSIRGYYRTRLYQQRESIKKIKLQG